jgi:Spy/CpxP family protein refolding chaperone
MKRKLISVIACLIVLLSLLAGAAQAQPLMQISIPGLFGVSEQQSELLKQLETEVLPQVESIFTPEQREQFADAVSQGTSFRKAFKALALTPQQKNQLATLFKSLPKKDIFATLTPEQKKGFFAKKKEMFMPTAEEMTDKIGAGLKKKEMFAPTSAEASEKMNAGMKKKEQFMPSLEEIKQKISEKMTLFKEEE